ncbi:hypothetical protein AMECASPLE_028114 [Ameca splendens]|uniref:Uncharacterized protein n=1 Tax=Ameca splendens TaxID=208324 RepID=A0ABV0XU91_9TELE
MRFPNSCLRFGPPTNHTVTEGTNQMDQADRAKELKSWIKQQDETLCALYGEEVEICSSPLLLEEMEECVRETDWAAMTSEPGQNCSSPAHASSKLWRSRCKHSTPAAAAPAELVMSIAASPQLKLTAASAEPSSPPPAAAEFLAGFSSRPGRRCRRRAAATGRVWVDASYVSTEGPPTMASSRLFPPVWVQSGPETPEQELMRLRMMDFTGYRRSFPEELDFVHFILEAEFLGRGWLDTPVPLSAGGLFSPLLEAAARSSEPQPAATGFTGPQPAAARSTPRVYTATAGRHRVATPCSGGGASTITPCSGGA